MAYTFRYVRVTPSGKLEDRFLTVQLSRADDPAKANYGTLFNLIEITSRWFPTSQIAQSIINTLRREYYKGASTSDLENFENALKKVNEQLASITQNGETEWIGNLHAQLVLVNGNEAHLCSTGASRSYLLREGKAIQVSEPRTKPQEETHPLKTFSTITSGSLQDRDFLFVCSAGLFDHLGTEDLKEAIQEGTPYLAAVALVRLLKHHKTTNVSFCLIQILTDQSAAIYPLGEPEVIYTDQPLETPLAKLRRIVNQYIIPVAAKGAVVGKKAAQKTAHIFRVHIVPRSRIAAKLLVEKGKPLAKQALERTKESVGQLKIRAIKKSDTKAEPETETQADSLIGKTIFNIHDYTTPKRRLNIPLYNRLFFQRVMLFVKNRHNRPLLYIIGTIILVFVLVISISVQKKNEQASKQQTISRTTIDDARRRLEEGKTALIFNNKLQAQAAFADSIKLAKEAISAGKFADEGRQVLDEAEVELDKLVGSNRLKNLTKAVGFSAASKIAVAKGKVLAIDAQSQQLSIGDLVDGQTRPISGLEGKITNVFATKDAGYILTESAIYQFDPDKLSVDKIKLADDASINKGVDISEFLGNLYLLSPADNQIWKYQLKDGVYQQAVAYFKSKQKITGAIAMAIDGSIYTLDDQGKISKFSQGNPASFNLTGLPKGLEKIEKPVTVFTAEESSSVYVVDGGALPRILEFDKQGKFLQQFLFQSDLSDLKDIWFQSTGRKAWALFGNSVYELNL